MMEEEVVRRRGWLSRGQFLDYVGATNLIPGPNSTELAIHIGHARGGWPGLLVAGISFIIPAVVIVSAAAWAYTRYGSLSEVAGLMYGIKPVVIAIVAQALWNLGRVAVRNVPLAMLAVAGVVAMSLGIHELVVLAGSGATVTAMGPAATVPFALGPLFLVFVKTGAVLFGSGYVLLAFLRADLVDRLGWITETQLLDAIAVGQITPGPVFTTATFIGYFLGGPAGGVVATVGIFLPAFVFVALSGPVVPRLRRSPSAAALLDGVNVASLALMAWVSWQLARTALVDTLTMALAAAGLVVLMRVRINSVWLVLVGGAVGWLLR